MRDYLKKKIISENFDFEEILLIPILATLLAVIIGCLFLLATGETFENILVAFTNLFIGSFGSLNAISEALTHSDIQITKTYVNTTETVNQTAGEIAFRSLKK